MLNAGGWLSLDEFLQKFDPCRMKGRTNLNLKDHLSESAGQGIAGYLSRSQQRLNETRASNERLSAYPSDGPVTKIREKTERSLPLGRTIIETTTYTDTVISRPKRTPAAVSFGKSEFEHPLKKRSFGSQITNLTSATHHSASSGHGPSREPSDLSSDSIDEYINKFDK